MGKDIVSVWKSSAERLRLIIFGCLGMLGTQYCYFACIKVSNAAAATVLEYIMPVLIIMWYCMREKRLPRGRKSSVPFSPSSVRSSSRQPAT